MLRKAGFQAGVVRLRRGHVERHRINHVGISGGDLLALVGGAGLHNDWPPLRCRRRVQRATHLEVLALVVQHVQFLGVEKHAACLVADEGIVLPTVPQSGNDAGKLRGALVTCFVVQVRFAVEVACLLVRPGGDDVPRGAPAADVIQGRVFSRNVERLVVAGRRGGNEADMTGVRRQRGHQGQRLELGNPARAALRAFRLIAGAHTHAVGQEHQVEAGAFRGLRGAQEVAIIQRAGGGNIRPAPRRDMVAVVAHRQAEPHAALRGHRYFSPWRGRAPRDARVMLHTSDPTASTTPTGPNRTRLRRPEQSRPAQPEQRHATPAPPAPCAPPGRAA